MKCPYCGAETYARICEYCGSELIRPKEYDEVASVIEEKHEKEEKPKKKAKKPVTMESIFTPFVTSDMLRDDFSQRLFDENHKPVEKGRKISKAILKTLQIKDDDVIYLLHDDTLLKTGGNGFAYTSRGIHVKEMFEKYHFIDYETFASYEKLVRDSTTINADYNVVAYFCGVEDTKDRLYEAVVEMHEMFQDKLGDNGK